MVEIGDQVIVTRVDGSEFNGVVENIPRGAGDHWQVKDKFGYTIVLGTFECIVAPPKQVEVPRG